MSVWERLRGVRAVQAPRALAPVPTGPHGYTAGWAPGYGTPHPSQQIGRFDGQMLNQYPANIPGVQLHQGVEGLDSRWYVPTVSYQPNGALVTSTTRPTNITGGNRYGAMFSGPSGPISARANAARVSAAAVRQSGLAASQWAQGLSSQ